MTPVQAPKPGDFSTIFNNSNFQAAPNLSSPKSPLCDLCSKRSATILSNLIDWIIYESVVGQTRLISNLNFQSALTLLVSFNNEMFYCLNLI